MTVLLRSLIVWLMLLALPYQGYASATMLLCLAPAQATMAAGAHDHAAMMAGAVAHDDGDKRHQHGGSKSAHGGMKCSGSACCAAAAPVTPPLMTVPSLPLVSALIPFYSDFLPAVHLAHPDRPPQGIRA